jgi:P27 family predicted phage terminase small subunit
MKPGPPPKPTVLEIREGFPGHRGVNRFEPKPREIRPKCPAFLSKYAKREWKRIVPILERMRVLTEADGTMLAIICADFGEMQEASEHLAKQGLLVKTFGSGVLHQNPLINIIDKAKNRLSRNLQEFGMSPSARTRIHVNAGEEPMDEIESALCGGKPKKTG